MTVKTRDNGHKATAHADTGARDAGAAETVESQRTDTQRSDVSTQSKPSHRTALIDVGGGFRAIFGAGVMDRCQEEGITFDHCYGVSAGSANMVSFLAGQHGRNHKFYTEYAFRKEYASFDSYVKHHNFANLDYVYGTLSNHDGEYPVDYEAFAANPTGFTVIACNALDGSAKYFDKSDVHYDDFNIMKLRRPCRGLRAVCDRRRPVFRRWHRRSGPRAEGH